MKNLIIIIKKFIKIIKTLVLKFYYNLVFLFNKQKILQKMYEPLTADKYKINSELLNELQLLKKENISLQSNIHKLKKENSDILNKILIIQNILTKHN